MKNLLKLIFILALLSIYSCEEQLPEPIAVTSVSLNAESIEMTEGDQLELIATVSPNNAENKTIIWSSSNASIASVVNGKVTALKAGKATITVKTDDGGKTATCEVTVNKKKIPKAESLQIGFVNISGMKDGYFLIDKVYDFFATAYPEDAITEYEWSVEDTDIATISDNTQTPRLTTKNYGDTPIIVKDKISGVSASYIVKTCITDFKFNSASSITLTVGENYKLNSSYSPAKATGVFKRLSSFRFREFDSSTGNYIEVPNPSCFDITKNGFITAKKAGKTLMQIKEDGIYGSNSEIMITVVENVSNVILDKNNIELVEGDSFTLTATIIPSDAVNKNVRWSSSNTSVASVSNGKVTALKAGKATITVTTVDGGKTATCNVTVVEPPKATSLSLSDSSINGYIYRDHSKIYRVSISASPSNAVTDYQWSSSNTRVAKVQAGSNSCIIYTEDYGEAIISVTDKRTGLSASMTIHTLVEDFTWNEFTSETMYGYPMITVYLNEEHKLKYSYSPSHATKIFSDLNQFVFYENNSIVNNPTYISISEDGVVKGLKAGVIGIKPTGLVVRAAETDRLYIKVKDRYTSVTGISLNKTYLSMTQYDTEQLSVTISPSDATDKSVTWSSDNPSVAKVDSKGLVTAVSGGSAVIKVRSEDSSLTASCTVNVTADSHEAVDLGLSVKWATCNYNAASPYEIGGYYLWGDPTGNAKIGFSFISNEMVPNYNAPNMDSIGGTSYDIVRAKWGGKWRLPSMSEFNELYMKCTWKYTSMNGVYGMKVTGPNGNSIFLPMTGYAYPSSGPVGSFSVTDSESGYYMTSQSYKDSAGRFAYSCRINSDTSYSLPSWRVGYAGMPIRPVR